MLNRRNALIGWIALRIATRFGRRQITKPSHKVRNSAIAVALAAAAGAAVTWWRHSGGSGDGDDEAVE
jgi:hypothetical protein